MTCCYTIQFESFAFSRSKCSCGSKNAKITAASIRPPGIYAAETGIHKLLSFSNWNFTHISFDEIMKT